MPPTGPVSIHLTNMHARVAVNSPRHDLNNKMNVELQKIMPIEGFTEADKLSNNTISLTASTR